MLARARCCGALSVEDQSSSKQAAMHLWSYPGARSPAAARHPIRPAIRRRVELGSSAAPGRSDPLGAREGSHEQPRRARRPQDEGAARVRGVPSRFRPHDLHHRRLTLYRHLIFVASTASTFPMVRPSSRNSSSERSSSSARRSTLASGRRTLGHFWPRHTGHGRSSARRLARAAWLPALGPLLSGIRLGRSLRVQPTAEGAVCSR